MALIPQITLEELAEKIRNGKTFQSSEVFSDGKYVGTFIVPSMIGGATIYHEIRTHAEYLGVRGNIVIPVEKADNSLTCECGFRAVSPFGLKSHRRVHKDDLIPV